MMKFVPNCTREDINGKDEPSMIHAERFKYIFKDIKK